MKSLIYDKIRLGVAVLLYLCATSWADAKVKLPALISDGMVLQREQSVKVWGTADAGENITIEFQKKSYHATADANGQWSITLPPLKAGGPFLMQINDIKLNDILVGDVWLCSGQSNMELPVKRVMDMFSNEILNYNNEKIRHILSLKSGKNNITVRIISNGGQPGFVQEKPYKIICDNEEINLKQKWKYRLGAPMPPAPEMMFFWYKPVCLYNAMIAPLQNYSIRGVLWYQGESNVSRRNEYVALLSAMIADWRRTFNQPGLPFHIVELADFLSKDNIEGRKAWAEMRQEQAKAAAFNSNTYLIRNSDLGEWNDIHPLDKKTLGKRAAESVLNSTKQ